ncbi:biotin-dependent 3-methylcrotonyl-coenzyme A carboxylase beta1 subunit-like isoform X1 [Vidua chalybeata]|uniref:biotin-dependent 3-methylcrotonyl-coenzyme A carboxylase beta1 subunit-like isoform X1 n=1 Tax=Vidua chalybeata TaxID=81927 RepID=UPI0023A8B80A|nr:biotin-dependent 3-methylcrotonyl-coenzyme A carboxylase beta1 subunit-like isoform X1 [Vidua chalybeata]
MSPARTRVSPHGPRGRPGTGVVPSRQNGVRVSPYDPRCHSAEGTRSVIPVARCPSALGAMWSPAPLCALGRRRPGPSAPLQPLTRLLQREYRQKTPTRLLQREYEAKTPFCLPQREYREKTPFCLLQKEYEAKTAFCLLQREYRELPLPGQGWGRTQHLPPRRFLSKKPKSKRHPKTFPVLDGHVPAVYQHVFEENLRNSEAVIKRYSELLERVKKGGGEHAILRHTQRNKKVFVRERLRLLLDGADFLELSPLAGLDMPYGDVPAAGCLTGIGRICGVWCVFIASDATVKGGTIYPIGVKKQLRAQEIAMENRLLSVHLVDSGGAFLPLQSELFPDKLHGGRIFYNEAIMSAMGIPQVAVVCGSCVAGGAYVPTMAEESVIIDKIGTLFLAGPPLVKAATGEDVSPEDLGGARLHSQVSGCSDHFAPSEEEAYECIRNVVSTLNCEPVPEQDREPDSPLYSPEELLGLAPLGYSCTLPVKLVLSRLVDGSRFQEFKATYGTTLVTGFGHVEGHLVGIVANNGELAHDAALKGSHFVQLCGQRGIPILFLQNTAPQPAGPASISQAEAHSNRLKAQASMMAAVACAAVPKITIVIGGCFGSDSYIMCGRSFSPNFLFLWPNARVGLVDSQHFPTVPPAGDWTGEELELKQLKAKLEEESSAFYSSARLWDDGIILPQDTRKVIAQCLEIMEQKKYQAVSPRPQPIIRM